MKIPAVSVFMALACLCSPAKADVFYTLIGVSCDASEDRLVIDYLGAWDEQGKQMTVPHATAMWRGEQLLDFDENSNVSVRKPVSSDCALTHGRYRVRVTGKPGSSNVGRRCGAQFAAWIEVWRDDTVVLPRTATEGDCFDNDPVITQIVFLANAPATVTRVSAGEFYK